MNYSPAALAQLVRSSYAALGKAAAELGDKIDWKPLDKGRSALDMVHECAGFGFLGERVFKEHAMPQIDWSAIEKMKTENDTAEKALPLLAHSADVLARAIEAFPADELNDTILLPFNGGMEKSFTEVAVIFYWNATYHEGQTVYIQTLSTPD